MKRFAIAAGGTGGHLFPGLAVAEVLHAWGHQVLLLTSEKHIDAVATEGRSEFQIARLPGMGLPRGISLQTLKFLARFARGILHCRSLFAGFKPDAVLGMGGFTSIAPILAGRLSGLPVFVHESNAIPGKANRLNARIAGGWLAGFEECARTIPSVPCTVTGTPVRGAFLQHPSKEDALRKFGLSPERKTVLVMGGSQGAAGVNLAVMEAAAHLASEGFQFLHITGAADEKTVANFYQKSGIPAWTAAFHHAMQDAYSAADIAVARSGAASLTELSFFGLPSILIPYPFAAEDHQTCNAKIFSDAGAALLVQEREATGPFLAAEIRRILGDAQALAKMTAACRSLYRSDAAERVARVLLAAAEGRRNK
jgi:UDP-N-acetylglucosamine--N-acetylmuramyl-(pentapeptide) pyrophosphoryl-undecaprenol N-acetylglucosamine transferase